MTNDNVNQLAETLRAAGLCGSMLDAKNMAASISSGVSQRHSEVESRIVKHMGTGQREGGFEVIQERVTPNIQQPQQQAFVAPAEEISEEQSTSDDAQKASLSDKQEVFVNQSSVSEEMSQDAPLSEIMKEVDDIVESVRAEEEVPEPEEPSPEPEGPSPEPEEPTPEPEQPEVKQSSLSIFEEEKPADIVVQASQEKEVLAEVEPQKVEPGPSRQVYSGQPQQQPQKRNSFEVPVDKSKPRATLTEQEKKDADIGKWFYFGNK